MKRINGMIQVARFNSNLFSYIFHKFPCKVYIITKMSNKI